MRLQLEVAERRENVGGVAAALHGQFQVHARLLIALGSKVEHRERLLRADVVGHANERELECGLRGQVPLQREIAVADDVEHARADVVGHSGVACRYDRVARRVVRRPNRPRGRGRAALEGRGVDSASSATELSFRWDKAPRLPEPIRWPARSEKAFQIASLEQVELAAEIVQPRARQYRLVSPAAIRGASSKASPSSPTSTMPSGNTCSVQASSRKPPPSGHGCDAGGNIHSGSGGVISRCTSAACAACASTRSRSKVAPNVSFSGSVARLRQHEVLQHIDVALQIGASGIAAHDVAQERERALEILLIDRELRERNQRVLAMEIDVLARWNISSARV